MDEFWSISDDQAKSILHIIRALISNERLSDAKKNIIFSVRDNYFDDDSSVIWIGKYFEKSRL